MDTLILSGIIPQYPQLTTLFTRTEWESEDKTMVAISIRPSQQQLRAMGF